MTFAKFEGNRFRIDGEIAENHAILVSLTASIDLAHLHMRIVNEWVRVLVSSLLFLYMLKRQSNKES